jgi:hypothetical protein
LLLWKKPRNQRRRPTIRIGANMSEFRRVLEDIKDDAFSDHFGPQIEKIERGVANGTITEEIAVKELVRIQDQFGRGSLVAVTEDDWKEIKAFIDTAEKRYIDRGKLQFYVGTFSIPSAAILAILPIIFGWQVNEGAVSIVGLVTAVLTALSAHSFFVLRVHQQATTAAERLVEKKLALLFLQAAMGPGGKDRPPELMTAGTTMFLGHHAPQTLLSPDDLKKIRQESKE